MDNLRCIDKLKRELSKSRETIRDALSEGAVPDYTAYQKLRAKYEAFNEIESLIRTLLKQEDLLDD